MVRHARDPQGELCAAPTSGLRAPKLLLLPRHLMQAIVGADDAARPASKRAGLEHLQVCALHPLHQ